jgi:hypothetical protein
MEEGDGFVENDEETLQPNTQSGFSLNTFYLGNSSRIFV